MKSLEGRKKWRKSWLLSGLLLLSCAPVCETEPSKLLLKEYSQQQNEELLNELEELPANSEIENRLLDYQQLRARLRSL